MNNSFGERFRFTIFGESHGDSIGVTMEGLPVGFAPDLNALQAFLDRRAPGRHTLSSSRKEADVPLFTEGLINGAVTGTVTAIIRNNDARPGDYATQSTVPRPGHADYTAYCRYGAIPSGGGAFSGRMTAPLCIAGGFCLQLLAKEGIAVHAEAESIAGKTDPAAMDAAISKAKVTGDSVGGTIACTVVGLPVGIGEPMFCGMENLIAQAVFAIPGIKGIEFGSGFTGSRFRGSQNNDEFYWDGHTVRTRTNHHGGILGGMTSGMPLTFRVAVKPTPSIAKKQRSVELITGKETELEIHGRHDPCIVPRAVPCVEAAAAVAVYDALLRKENDP